MVGLEFDEDVISGYADILNDGFVKNDGFKWSKGLFLPVMIGGEE